MLTKNTSNCWFDAEKMLDFHASLFRATFHSVCHIFSHSLSRFRLHARALILDQQHFFIHNAYDTYVFIGHTSIRNDKNDNDLHQLYMCVCVYVDGLQSKNSSIIYVWNGKQADNNNTTTAAIMFLWWKICDEMVWFNRLNWKWNTQCESLRMIINELQEIVINKST